MLLRMRSRDYGVFPDNVSNVERQRCSGMNRPSFFLCDLHTSIPRLPSLVALCILLTTVRPTSPAQLIQPRSLGPSLRHSVVDLHPPP
jgi:hypothetical protein